VVTRDGDSAYFLNGGRCRRRDITDIFLGTGAGSRGYSIIGQGTISRIIEAKPDELRAYLEEAAGVSKYKERRRETLQRIEHTRDNLTRVTDIRDELDKQLQRLERQAKAAERYTLLKEEEKQCRAEILAFKWQDFVRQQLAKQKELDELTLRYEQQQSVLTSALKERTLLNEKLHESNDKTQQTQTAFYQLGTKIARLEETIQQQDREKKRLETERQQMQEDWRTIDERLKEDKEELQQVQLHAQALEQQLRQLKQEFLEQEQQWQEAQKHKTHWEEHCQEVQMHINTLKREQQVTQVSLQHNEQNRNQTLVRLEKLRVEHDSVSLPDLQQAKKELSAKEIHLKEAQKFDEQQLKQNNETLEHYRQRLKEAEQQLHQLQDDSYRLNSELGLLVASQKAARSGHKQKAEISQWTEKQKLMDVLQVEPGWQSVCDMVLNDSLYAYVLDTFEELWPQWEACEHSGQAIVTMSESTANKKTYPRLTDKIVGKIPATVQHLDSIYTAEDLDEARSWLPNLLDHESIVTANGVWLGKGWVKLKHPEDHDEEGVLVRQQKITDLSQELAVLQQKIETVKTARDEDHAQVQETIKKSELFQLNLNASNEALRINTNALTANEQEVIRAERMVESMDTEIRELNDLLEQVAEEHLSFTQRLVQLESLLSQEEQKQEQINKEKTDRFTAMATEQNQLEAARLSLHQLELEFDRATIKTQQLTESIAREQERLDVVQDRLEQLTELCLKSSDPESECKEQLDKLLVEHAEIEAELATCRDVVAHTRIELETLEKNTNHYDLEAKKVQEDIGQARIQEQSLAVRASSIHESIDELGLQAQTLLDHIAAGVTQSAREDDLIALSEKVKRLGAINLAAIEEFATEQKRKLYLDEQFEDLNSALAALESAIEKIDNETRLRLENTFDEVNTSFKALFPRLFGGGKAQLELTCTNLLEAGIVVMAQPPGKRNSTIHLLSGGEKAMTAVALVFAIFQLNPSPFCMLDEVDAPLDDLNVKRFCDLVKEMSQFVQFLFITHNKVTMELANHLIGVTMREPGVSRLVTVDVQQALTME